MGDYRFGFTGTQHGMTDAQKATLREFLRGASGEFHHGDCIGADMQFHDIARSLGLWIVVHPPINQVKQAHCDPDESRLPKEYLTRNDDITRECDLLIAAPKEDQEILRSGTWSTVRRARRYGREIRLILPSGETLIEATCQPERGSQQSLSIR